MTATATRTTRRPRGARLAATLAGGPAHRLFVRWPRLATPAVAGRLLDASREHLRVDARAALLVARAATIIAGRLHDPQLLAQSHRAAANALCVSGDIREALELHERAQAAFEAAGDERELARTLSASIQPLILLGRYDRALAAAGRARELFERQGDERRLARLEINVGNLHHRQDRFDAALACYESAHARLVALGDTDGVIGALHNKAVTLTALNECQSALAAYQSARRLSVERGLPLAVAQTDYNIAWLHYMRGEYHRAITLLQQAAAFAGTEGDGYHAALSLLDLSEVYLELNLNEDAYAFAEDARGRFRQLGLGYEEAKALVNVAIAVGREGHLAQAVELFAEARERLVDQRNAVWPSLIDLYQAMLLLDEGRVYEARRLAVDALEFFSKTTLRTKTALCRLVLARIHLRLAAPEAARRECELALAGTTGRDAPSLRYHAYVLLGHAERAGGDRVRAEVAYEEARQVLETLRTRVHVDELKIAFARNKQEVYERLLELRLEDPPSARGAEEILSCIEHAKSRALLELMDHPVHALAQQDDAGSPLARSIQSLRQELAWFHHRIQNEELRTQDVASPQLEDLQRELEDRERRFARVLLELRSTSAPEAELHAPDVCGIEAIRAALPPNAVLLEYFTIGDRIIMCLLDHDRLQVIPLTSAPAIESHVRTLQFHMSKFRLGDDYVDEFGELSLQATRAHLRSLFAGLFGPVWPEVRGRHLLVVPHGFLHDVPFAALLDGDRYVVDDCTVSYAPSASTYVKCHARRGSGGEGALVLGLSDGRAAFIEAEAQAVAAILPRARLFVGTEATEDALRTHGPSSRFVHISMHGHFRRSNPMFSGVQLADTYLSVYDLYRLNLPAGLVTLSGCATGAHVAAAGDELIGITRGLFCAGAQASLVSLWDVHDECTAQLMTSIYSRAVAGTTVVDAIHEAMIELRRDRPHPFYWAPFVLSGKFWQEGERECHQ